MVIQSQSVTVTPRLNEPLENTIMPIVIKLFTEMNRDILLKIQ